MLSCRVFFKSRARQISSAIASGDQSAKSGYPVGNDTRAMEPDAYRHLLQ